jgi:alkanesulfonate monooxygenase SsuD/methylene tetrahydromethanopterin reductase-like flavin-dependent oxidoreductase (luciferase family)
VAPAATAEDFATADYLTGGRVLFGVGRGYHTREMETFGAPMLDRTRTASCFEEQRARLQTPRHALHHSAAGAQSRYELEEITLLPRPLRRPVECWQPIVSANPRGLDFIVRNGIKGVTGGGAASGGLASSTLLAWQQALARDGRSAEPGADLVVGLMKMFARWASCPVSLTSRSRPSPFRPARARRSCRRSPRRQERRRAGRPARAHRRAPAGVSGPLARVDRSPRRKVVATPQRVIVEQLERFAREVMPAFRQQTPKAVDGHAEPAVSGRTGPARR